MVIGKDEEALLLDRLDDDLPNLVGCHQHTMEHGGAGCLSQGHFGVMPMARSVSSRLVSTLPGQRTETPIPWGGIKRQRFREADNGELRRHIGSALAGQGDQPGDRPGVDDVAAPRSSMCGRNVRMPRTTPRRLMLKDHSQSATGISSSAPRSTTCVIHQDINVTHGAQSGFAQALDIGVLGNIAMHGQSTPAKRSDGGTRLLKPQVVDICDDDIRPASGHGQRRASADPTGATRDDCDFPCELHSLFSLCLPDDYAVTAGSTSLAAVPALRSPSGRCVGISPAPPFVCQRLELHDDLVWRANQPAFRPEDIGHGTRVVCCQARDELLHGCRTLA